MTDQAETHASSTGQGFTGGAWLDAHFEAARPEYEAQLRAVGIQPGWHVLDAACGSGSFLPWLAELVGPGGSLVALDLAPDNVALVERRVAEWGLPCPVEARTGTVLALPYPDAAFDAAWFANTTQYLTDDELATALAELRRVVRPGGLVAVKEADASAGRLLPAPLGFTLRRLLADVAAGGGGRPGGSRVRPRCPAGCGGRVWRGSGGGGPGALGALPRPGSARGLPGRPGLLHLRGQYPDGRHGTGWFRVIAAAAGVHPP